MNKSDLTEFISSEAGISKAAATRAIDAFATAVAKKLARGTFVQIAGFGTFESTRRAARTGHNPATGESIKIPAKRVAKFKPGQRLKNALN